MTELDEQERLALDQFLHLLKEERFEPEPIPDLSRILRTAEGQIIVPVRVNAEEPSVSLALLMAHKADQVYKQTGCRFILAQQPERDPKHLLYVWAEEEWHTFS